MKRGGFAFAALLFISGILRIAGPSSLPPPESSRPAAKQAVKPLVSSGVVGPKGAYGEALAQLIADHFGCRNPIPKLVGDLELHWNVPPEARSGVRYVIAIVPDPVHTHLALFFDRTVESLELAVQQQGDYSFDRAILPWDYTSHKGSDGPAARLAEQKDREERERYPGLLIFHSAGKTRQALKNGSAPNACSSQRPLFVFLVAETPTSGIRSKQFQNALQIMRDVRSGPALGPKLPEQPLLILGPIFSGSLGSLKRQLTQIPFEQKFSGVYTYSGTITGTASVKTFKQGFGSSDEPNSLRPHFASFQESDDYSIRLFTRFAFCRGYDPGEIAVLSEDDTAYGNQSSFLSPDLFAKAPQRSWLSALFKPQLFPCQDEDEDRKFNNRAEEMVYLHFPREISSFRSAYEKELAAQQQAAAKIPGKTSLSPDLEELGSDDDAVAPFAGGQNVLSQEAVMHGVISELQKHHIKFTILLASNPVDQLFLARYLRSSYPQGRVVVTTPDLLLVSQEDTLLHGVLGINNYAIVPGLSDSLCRFQSLPDPPSGHPKETAVVHEDRLFAASSNVGTYNAMMGLLTISKLSLHPASSSASSSDYKITDYDTLPPAPYAEYASPYLTPTFLNFPQCGKKPMTWLTILGRDGYWPIAALSDRNWSAVNHELPVITPSSDLEKKKENVEEEDDDDETAKAAGSGLLEVGAPLVAPEDFEGPEDAKQPTAEHTTPAWNMAYCLCFVLLLAHTFLSWTGSFLANSEIQAQFARTHDRLGVVVLAMGSFWLSNAFVLLMCTRYPLVVWAWNGWLTAALWAPLPLFLAFNTWDIAVRRSSPAIARWLATFTALVAAFQIALSCGLLTQIPYLWSPRFLHLASGVSPVLPFLLLFAAGYWWVWLSLRSMAIVDLRRPRLPAADTLPHVSFRISDKEGEKVRDTAHPVKFAWRVLITLVALGIISLTVLDLSHPLQSLEGDVYDWGYTLALGTAIAVYLGCLLRLILTWMEYKQVLTGLDRSPLREAFSRMKRLSWRSMWNPGGSTMRETYRVMSRALENVEKLDAGLKGVRAATNVLPAIAQIRADYQGALDAYFKFATLPQRGTAPQVPTANPASSAENSGSVAPPVPAPTPAPADFGSEKTKILDELLLTVEKLQKQMANTAGLIIRDVLTPLWRDEQEPVVSVDDRIKKPELPLVRALAEEYAALTYINFLQSVLLQMRTLVICAGGMYVLIVCSISVYPFEPHPALQALSVILLIVMAIAVGFVYAEMHRDAILSRLTSTNAGELGWDFWLKFISAGAIPVFSLLAVQFPEINKFLFSWLAPILQSTK